MAKNNSENYNTNNMFLDANEASKVLLKEGKKLEDIAKKSWARLMNNYRPVEYVRTGDSLKAIKLGVVKKLGEDTFGIELTWTNDLAYHDSWLYKKGKIKTNQKGHAIILMTYGWHSRKLEKAYGKRVYRHTYYQGNDFLGEVMREYEAVKDPRIFLELQVSASLKKK